MNYHGYSDTIYGDDGTCDSSGYTIWLSVSNAFMVSSVSKYGSCTASKFWIATQVPRQLVSAEALSGFAQ